MGKITVEPGKTQKIAERSESKTWRVTAEDGDVRIGGRKRLATSGDQLEEGQQATYKLELEDDLFAYNPGEGKVSLSINPRGLIVIGRNNNIQQTASRNFPDVDGDSHTASAAGETFSFKDQAIPRGSEMSVYPAGGNQGSLYLVTDSGDIPLKSGQSFSVESFSAPTFKLENSGETAYATAEVEN